MYDSVISSILFIIFFIPCWWHSTWFDLNFKQLHTFKFSEIPGFVFGGVSLSVWMGSVVFLFFRIVWWLWNTIGHIISETDACLREEKQYLWFICVYYCVLLWRFGVFFSPKPEQMNLERSSSTSPITITATSPSRPSIQLTFLPLAEGKTKTTTHTHTQRERDTKCPCQSVAIGTFSLFETSVQIVCKPYCKTPKTWTLPNAVLFMPK